MAVIEFILRRPPALALGWALVHFLWQGAVIGLVAAALLHAARDARASVRYAIGVAAMAVMVLSVGATWMCLANRDASIVQADQANDTNNNTMTIADAPGAALVASVASVAAIPARTLTNKPFGPLAMSVLLVIYGAGVVLLSIRLAGGWVVTRRMTRRSVKPAAHHLLVSAGLVAERLQISGLIRIVESSIVSTPAIVGWIAPIVLLPASSLAGLATIQIEALLAHEFAHIKRHDYLVNLVQSAIETLLFYHPAVWWVSRQIRIEREHCCDDVAVRACGDRMAYASALVDLETMRQSTFALAATDGSLASRVRRILAAPAEPKPATSGWMGVALVVAMAAVVPVAMNSARAAAGPTKILASEQKTPPSAAARAAAAPAQITSQKPSPYLIRATDTLHVFVAGEPTMTRNYPVQSDGVIVFPLIRPLKVVGLTSEAVAGAIAKSLAPAVMAETASPEVLNAARLDNSAVAQHLASYRTAQDDAARAHSDAMEAAQRLSSYQLENAATNVEACGILSEPEVRGDENVTADLAVLRKARQERANLTQVEKRLSNHPSVVAVDARIADDLAYLRILVTAIVDASRKREYVAASTENSRAERYNTYRDLTRSAAGHAAKLPHVTVAVVKAQGKTVEVAPAVVTVTAPQISAPTVLESAFVLPILSVPQTTPAVNTPEPDRSTDYRLAPHDTVRIHVAGAEGLFTSDARVITEDGTVSIYDSQSLRVVRLSGLTTHEAEAFVAQALYKDQLVMNPLVTIQVEPYRQYQSNRPPASADARQEIEQEPVAATPSTHLVFVTGEVGVPGQQHLGQLKVTLWQAISASGGVTSHAAAEIVIRRVDAKGVTREIRVRRDAVMSGAIEDPTLEDGDVIFVPRQKDSAPVATATVNGEVRSPKEVPWTAGMTVADAIATCGGSAVDGAVSRTTVQRLDPKTNKLTLVHVAQSELLKTKLQPGDVVTVPKRRF